jgi:aspartokinase
MLSLSATGINLTMVVDESQVAPAMRRLHDAFFPRDGAEQGSA